jgi:hypothetical protein
MSVIQENRFEFVLTHKFKAPVLMLCGVLLVIAFCIQIENAATALIGQSKNARLVLFLVTFGLGAYGIYRLVKRYASLPTSIVIAADKLIITSRATGVHQIIPYDNIATYRFVDFNYTAELRLKLVDGSKRNLWIHTLFHDEQLLRQVVYSFEDAISSYQSQNIIGEVCVAVREKTFFEKSISTFLLGPLTFFMIWVTWENSTNQQHTSGSFFSLWGTFCAYIAAWIAARARRNS